MSYKTLNRFRKNIISCCICDKEFETVLRAESQIKKSLFEYGWEKDKNGDVFCPDCNEWIEEDNILREGLDGIITNKKGGIYGE